MSDKLYGIVEKVEKECKARDRLLLLYLIHECTKGKKHKYPLTLERLQIYVFVAQKMGVPFSFHDWDWIRDWDGSSLKKENKIK